ncbi:MAG TPA: protein jag [Candidatus Eisenbergiella merdigallinarum]|uniref:RNA-binding protein KhpB n=1 Tax=Candidatus Eisenbergiella merdigallinarum TaxID=2838552 RepID=A0A9D2MU94_9FIRM|nr:protein jag [Candidatus Eisenbergiella merdigallinarum]
MEFQRFTAKTVSDAVTAACRHFVVTSDRLEYDVVEEGSSGFLGFNAKPAVILARVRETVEDRARIFLNDVFAAMNMTVAVDVAYDEESGQMDIDLSGDEMGVLIGKRGQTLDSLQYLVSLVVNKGSEDYIRVKVDTENYRKRRKDTLENLAKNIAYKVKRTRRPVSLEPMNPYERRIIHSALQNDRYVTTHSEGEEPFRHVVVTLKK